MADERYLEIGMRGPAVKKLQQDLNACRRAQGLPPIQEDGEYFGETYEAICEFQRSNSIDIDGVAGPDTQGKITNHLSTSRLSLAAGPTLTGTARLTPTRAPGDRDWIPGFSVPGLDIPNFRMPDVSLEPAPTPAGTRVYAAGSMLVVSPTDRPVAAPLPVAAAPVAVPRPRGPLRISATDILPPELIDDAMAKAGIKPEKREQFLEGLNDLVDDINDETKINPSMRGALARSFGEMYQNGYPVKFNNRRRDMTGRDKERPVSTAVTLDLDIEPLRGSTRFDRDHVEFFQRVMGENGLSIERGRHGLHVELEEMSLDELRESVEAANGGKRLKPIAPIAGIYRQTSEYGMRMTPRGLFGRRKQEFHPGMDFAPEDAGEYGYEVMATMPGRVTFAGRMGGYGNVVEIKDIYGETHRFAHLDRIEVKPGDVVQQGERVAMMGHTGRSTNVHLHYEQFDRNGVRRNPRENLDLAGKPVQVVPQSLKDAATRVVDEQVARVERAARAVREAAEKAEREAREDAARRAAEARRRFEEGKEAVVNTATAVADAAGGAWRGFNRLIGRS